MDGVVSILTGIMVALCGSAPLFRDWIGGRRIRALADAPRRCVRCDHGLHADQVRCPECAMPAGSSASDDARLRQLLRHANAVRERQRPWRAALAAVMVSLGLGGAALPVLAWVGVTLPVRLGGTFVMDDVVLSVPAHGGGTIRVFAVAEWLVPFAPSMPSAARIAAVGVPWSIRPTRCEVMRAAPDAPAGAGGPDAESLSLSVFGIDRRYGASRLVPFSLPLWELRAFGSGFVTLPAGDAAVEPVADALRRPAKSGGRVLDEADRVAVAAMLVQARESLPPPVSPLPVAFTWYAGVPMSYLIISAAVDVLVGIAGMWALRRDVEMPDSEWADVRRAIDARKAGWSLVGARFFARKRRAEDGTRAP